MTICTEEMESTRDGYYLLDPDDDETQAVSPPPRRIPPTSGRPRRGISDKWLSPDPLSELLDELKLIGRPREAEVIERVLGLDDDEEAMRAYVSRQWADAWDSPEDSVYDEE